MKTVYLDPLEWDLALDASGNIALAAEPYALAQDAASAIRTFRGEAYYNVDLGVPYWGRILGELPPIDLMKAEFTAAALTVPGVVDAKAFITGITDRQVTGQVQVIDASGLVSAAGF